MTGFGEATTEADGIVYTVEIRTVNNRYFKTHLRLPDIVAFLDGEIEKLLREQIYRGTVNYALRMKNVASQPLLQIDENAVRQYVDKLRVLAGSFGVQCCLDLAQLLNVPGILQPAVPDSTLAEKMKNAILTLTAQAVDQLKKMRAQEGQLLAEDLMENCRITQEKLKLIEMRGPIVVQEYHDKLKKRVEELLAGTHLRIDAEILAREVALFADRCDVAEELTRLDSHVRQFVEICGSNSNAGRRLDFISQEMLREANTIASKASDAKICQWVVDIKCAIDRIKEQVQNIE
jgi:uncharacterized protein (TIGR00255 family)